MTLCHYLSDKVIFFARTQNNEVIYVSEGVKHLGKLSREEEIGRNGSELADRRPKATRVYRDRRCTRSQSAIF